MKTHEKGLNAWQLTMMALGTVIGGSFFLGSAVAIHATGPSIVLAFAIGGALVYFILLALSEMTVAHPDAGSFRTFAAQAFGRGMGFVVGWVYWTGMVLAMSSEATAVAIFTRTWFPSVSIPLLGSAIIIGITLMNLLGASSLSKLESGLAAIKLLAVLSFIILGMLLIFGWLPHTPAIGLGAIRQEPFLSGGFKSFAGSMLIVMFTYAGFEIIGLAASEAKLPQKTIPKAIRYTVISLVGLYLLAISVLLPLISTASMNEKTSPIVAALHTQGFIWAGTTMNIVLVTAILSTMLAAMFGIGRMMRSLADEKLAPRWLQDTHTVPRRGILASGCAMLLALWFGMLFPRVYLFLISSGGFAILFSYVVIMATHIRLRRRNGCPEGGCQLRGFPYSSWLVLFALIGTILSMPFVSGQGFGLIAGVIITLFYALCYRLLRFSQNRARKNAYQVYRSSRMQIEASEELSDTSEDTPSS